MTPEELKQFIIERRYFVGWTIAMFIKQLYPERFKSPVRPDDDGVLLPGGCKLTKVRQGNKWFIKSYSVHDIDVICEELSQFETIDLDIDINTQNMHGKSTTWMPGYKKKLNKR